MHHGGAFQADPLYQQAPLTDDITSESMGQTSAVREHSHIPLLQLTQPQKGTRQTSEWAEPWGKTEGGEKRSLKYWHLLQLAVFFQYVPDYFMFIF